MMSAPPPSGKTGRRRDRVIAQVQSQKVETDIRLSSAELLRHVEALQIQNRELQRRVDDLLLAQSRAETERLAVLKDLSERTQIEASLRTMRERLERAFDAITDGLVIHEPDGNISESNLAAERILGLTRDQLAGRSSVDPRWQAIYPDGSPFPGETHPAMVTLRTGKPVRDVIMGVRKPSGQLTWISINSVPLPAASGVLVSFTDITEKKQAEESANFQAQLLRAVGQAVIATDLEGRISYLNPAAEALYGWSSAEVIGRSVIEVTPGQSSKAQAEEIMAQLAQGRSWKGEFPVQRRDGSTFLAEVTDAPILNAAGELVGMTGVSQDITQRKQAEEALRKSELFVHTVADRLPSGVGFWTVDLRCAFANQACLNWFGRSLPELVKDTLPEALGAELFRRMEPKLREALQGLPQSFELARAVPSGEQEYFWIEFVPHIVDEVVTGIIQVIADITEQKRGELARTQLSEIVQYANDAVIRDSLDGIIRSWNPGAERLFGYSAQEMIGQSIMALIPDDLRERELAMIARVQRGERVELYETSRLRKDGTRIDLELTLSPIKDASGEIVATSRIVHDVSERKSLQSQLQQSQKMEVIGQLAGGVAHDFNNILQVMILILEHLHHESELPEVARAPLQQLESLAQRAARVTAQLLMFARRQAVQLQTVDVNAALIQSVSLLRRLIGEYITFDEQLSQAELWAHADPGMLDQVIMNLCINARDAMPDGGRLTLATTLCDWTEQQAQTVPNSRPGRHVCLSVTDTGCGMTPEVLQHVFEPFFTTKEAGKGTGLGLAAVYGIVHQHRGFVQVESCVGKGSCFRVFLPAATKSVQTDQSDQSSLRSESPARRTQMVLLVEDEEMLRTIGIQLLSRQGYQVLAASDGHEAMKLFDEHEEEIALLISDMVMPGGLTGLQLGEQLRWRNPALKIILMSGYSEEIIDQESHPQAHIEFLAKPFRYQELLDTVHRCLG